MNREQLAEAMRWTEEEKARFVARFPQLHRWPDGRDMAYSGLIGRGWIPLLERAVIAQVKEKYAGLRVYLYHYGFDEELDKAVDDVELESETMCEACGAPARQSETRNGWIVTLCEIHLPEGAQYLDDLPPPPTSS